MGKLSDVQIRAWMRAGERFEGRADGGGLVLRYRGGDALPSWRFRYSIGGEPRVMHLGNYGELSLADARKTAKELRARVQLGHDVAGEKSERVKTAKAKIEAARSAKTVADLADEYFERNILGRWKHPNIVRSRIEKDIKPAIGALALEDVKPRHIDDMLKAVVKRGAPTTANDVLRWVRRMFDYGIKRHMVEVNPAAAFDLSDAGGKEIARERALSRDELVKFFEAMREAKGFSVENALAVKLLLALAVRKMELIGARWEEFDLDAATWHLPGERTKTGAPVDIPLAPVVVGWLRELQRLADGSEWVFPARKMQTRMVPHICESTIGVALGKVKHGLPHFTAHDFRRTARTHLAALGVEAHVAERCLNHKLKGVEGIYNRHDYFEERKAALATWAALLVEIEAGDVGKVVPIKGRKRA
ncbi:MAG: tyrosine-type recombinase/integrase [Rhodocyclales bacterium]|nr:tyrosine-type recombinase/integrase [Rhodocyclales bacterium]